MASVANRACSQQRLHKASFPTGFAGASDWHTLMCTPSLKSLLVVLESELSTVNPRFGDVYSLTEPDFISFPGTGLRTILIFHRTSEIEH